MTKKKPTRSASAPKRLPFKWTDNEAGFLLAWSDECAKGDLDYESTIVRKLEQKWPNREYEDVVVKQKTYKLWKKYRKDESTRYQELFVTGTKCLNLEKFSDGLKLAYNSASIELSGGHRALRSRTVTISPGPTGLIQERIHSPIVLISPRRPQKAVAVRTKVENESFLYGEDRGTKRIASADPKDTFSIKKSRLSPRRSTRLRTEVPDSDDHSDSNYNSVLSYSFSGAELSARQVSEDRESHVSNQSDFLSVYEEQELKIARAKARVSDLEMLVAERNKRITALEAQNKTLQRDNTHLSNQTSRMWRETEDWETKLKDRDQCWKNANKRGGTEQELVEAIKESEEMITTMNRKLTEIRRISQPELTSRTVPKDSAPNMVAIARWTKDLFLWSNLHFSGYHINAQFGQDIKEIFAVETGSELASIMELAGDIGTRNLLRAITAGALRKWVFGSHFPLFDEEESELLAVYRKTLLTQDGPQLARNRDFFAHEVLLGGRHFKQHVLPRRIEETVVRLSKFLAPFFRRNSRRLDDEDETWGQDEQDFANRRDLCRSIFEKAFQLKLDLLLTTNQYELRAIDRGSLFDSEFMRAETSDGAPINDSDITGGTVVKCCLFPAFYSHAPQQLRRNQFGEYDISQLVVQSQNFVSPGDYDAEDSCKIISKAVVLLERED